MLSALMVLMKLGLDAAARCRCRGNGVGVELMLRHGADVNAHPMWVRPRPATYALRRKINKAFQTVWKISDARRILAYACTVSRSHLKIDTRFYDDV